MNVPHSGMDLILVAAMFAVSLFNAAIGPTGGAGFAVMASILPPHALIPIHGTTESLSALYRALLLRAHIDRKYALRFIAGAVLGLPFGLALADALPPRKMLAILGLFILMSVWWPFGRGLAERAGGGIPAWLAGALSTGVTMVVGATGPMVAGAMSRRFREPRRLLGTHAACMTVQHGVKLPAFLLTGFDFRPYFWLLAALTASALAGTWAGRRVLGRWPEAHFPWAFRLLMTVLAARLLLVGTGVM